jgi:hypothetical protein
VGNMNRNARIVLVTVAGLVLFCAGLAAAGVDLRKVILKPGHCLTVAKLRVCAAKAKTKTVTRTVTSPPLTVTSTVTQTQTVTTTPTPKIAFSDGTYRVGPDIQSGTYRSTATASGCYWERLKGFSGTLDDIIANYIGISPTIVAIAPTDVGFRSDGCGGWEKVG